MAIEQIPDFERSAVRRVLVIHTAFLGDVVLGAPFFQELRRQFPNARLIGIVRKGVGDLVLRLGFVDEVFEVKKGDSGSHREALAQARREPIDLTVSPHPSFRTALMARRTGAPHRVGFRRWWNGFGYGVRVVREASLPEPVRQLALLAPFDAELSRKISDYSASGLAHRRETDGHVSRVPDWARASITERLDADRATWTRVSDRLSWSKWSSRKKALLFPGSVWATKRWTEEGFRDLAIRLQADGVQVFWMGAPDEAALCERLSQATPGSVSLAGSTSLYETLLLMRHSGLVVGNDSASIHLASLARTPIISVFGPTIPEFGFRPWSDDAWVIEKKDLACRPCGPHGHARCPLGTHACMKDLAAEPIAQLAVQVLESAVVEGR